MSAMPKVREMAHQAREFARHYGDFKVGCVGWAQGKIFMGANYKPTQDAEPTCAEEQVMLQVIELGLVLDGMVIVGQPRKEDTTPTLHCCGERCRPRMRNRIREGTAVRPDTQLICVNAITGVREEFTVETLHQFHNESLDDE